VGGDAGLEFSPYASTLVLQPTPLCNLRCTYCYLPDLSDRRRMDPALPTRLAAQLADNPPDWRMAVRWHGGEPLTVGIEHLGRLCDPFEALRSEGRLQQSIQTNATLVTDEWCDFFRRYDMRVGVSIDGPRWANRERRTLSGAEAFGRTMRGIDRLRHDEVRFWAIAVVSLANIPVILERTAEFLTFFRSIGVHEVGFNIEENEGGHHTPPGDRRLVTRFWQAVFDAWTAAGCQPAIRDFTQVLDFAEASLAGDRRAAPIDLLPTVTCDGDVVLLSPELAGYRDERYDDFRVGNVYDEPLGTILRRAPEVHYVRKYNQGAARCRSACRYFDYCRAGPASNRYFEHGDFVTNETDFCRHSRQAPFDVVTGAVPITTD
jgi:uncharacterized protein